MSPSTGQNSHGDRAEAHSFRAWVAWEFDRSIEVTPAIRIITVERFVKAFVLIAGGLALLIFGEKTNIHQWATELQEQYSLSPGSSWWSHLYQKTLNRLAHLSTGQEGAIAAGAMLYGALEAFEGFGLLLRRRWAEYLVLVATAAFLPLEIVELIHKPTVFKAGAFLINLLIIGYLVWRKRLFLERPEHWTADRTQTGNAR